MHLSMSSRRGERRGIGRGFDVFQKIAVKFPTPGQKCEVKYNWNFPAREMICGHRHTKKFKCPLRQQDNSNALPRAKVINQIPTLCPASPLFYTNRSVPGVGILTFFQKISKFSPLARLVFSPYKHWKVHKLQFVLLLRFISRTLTVR